MEVGVIVMGFVVSNSSEMVACKDIESDMGFSTQLVSEIMLLNIQSINRL